MSEYSKHWPWYAKIWKWIGYKSGHINCRAGRHIPVGMTDKEDNIIEVFCQECAADLTLADWNKFWKGDAKEKETTTD